MALLWEPEFWARLFGIGVLNLLLSGDNALVIALAVRALPPRQRVLGQGRGGLVAVEMVCEDKAVVGWLGAMGMQMKMPVSVGAGAVVAALGWWLARRPHAAVPEDI